MDPLTNSDSGLTPEEEAKFLKALELARKRDAEAKANETDPATRPTFDAAVASDSAADSPVFKKGYFPPGVKPESLKGINVNLFPRGDIDNYSVARMLLATAKSQHNPGAFKRIAPWEAAYIDAMEKANLGDQVSGTDGGFLAPELWTNDFYDRLYPAMVIGKLPVTRIRMTARTEHFPKLTNGVSIYYSPENAAITASSPTFAQTSLTARKQSALTYISNELILDSAPDAENVLRGNLVREMAVDKDKQILLGNGQGGTPTGVLNATNVTTYSTGASLVYTDLTTGIFNVEVLNGSTNVGVGQAECTGIVGNPVLKKQIANFKDSNGRPLWMYGLNGMALPGNNAALANFLGVQTFVTSTILPGTESSQNIFFGDWQYLLVADRMDLEFMASDVAGTAFASDQTACRVIHRYDVAVVHPEAFYVLTGVKS